MPKAYLQFNIGIADLLHVEALPWERFIGPLVFFYTSICRSRRLLGCWHLGMICTPWLLGHRLVHGCRLALKTTYRGQKFAFAVLDMSNVLFGITVLDWLP